MTGRPILVATFSIIPVLFIHLCQRLDLARLHDLRQVLLLEVVRGELTFEPLFEQLLDPEHVPVIHLLLILQLESDAV